MTFTLITDHPAWHEPHGQRVRLVEYQGAPWLAVCSSDQALTLRPAAAAGYGQRPPLLTVTSSTLPAPRTAAPLVQQLASLGTVQRLTNPSLWDAITTAILRQVVRADQARRVYRTWCQEHGPAVPTPAGAMSLCPAPETVLDLSDQQFAQTGTTFHRTALRAAAAAYRDHHHTWKHLGPDDLVKALQEVPRIGPWTAAAAAADYTGDFAVYPHGDLAVRTWARRAAPDHPFPDGERAFSAYWRRLANEDRTHLHALTLFTLTWGSHVRTAQPGDTPHPPA
ncbi:MULTISPECIES: DNA glycosylase family protein [Streptomyces]|uniref:hypothetical protein n=1 Tax=Streptomyces TaxID=1883 RepID=UPI0007C5CEC6|nr:MULTISPECIES: hypothetical protein [Streptomyces]